ncbi:MAG TPA: alpha/beta hydrolase [Pseudonocardiaceae bacterium]|jgi:predicted dienelactone hydrolase|nr:alpha/beta hydrolase [Pseudonocardiaceae bacterium]
MNSAETPAAPDPRVPSAMPDTPYLPEPTGRHAVGTTSRYLKDSSRPDPWVAGVDARELMVSLWYPAVSADGDRAPYLTARESELLLADSGITSVPGAVLSTTRTNAVADARPVGRERTLPLVVLSPGFTKPRATLTALAEDLASNGCVVVAIDHTYENSATTFPDGRVTTCRARETRARGAGFWEKVVAGRAADVSFVLDELTGAHPTWPYAALIDPARIAMVGHSIGGASSIAALLADPRIRAGINIDGSTHAPIPAGGLARPLLLLGKRSAHSPGIGKATEATWERDWTLLTGWRRWLVVTGALHVSFTDLGLLAGQLGIGPRAELPAARAMDITRDHVRAFVDLHLCGTPQPLLDRPSANYPEVTYAQPAESAH